MNFKSKRYKPRYKQFIVLRENVVNSPKLFNFKKKKWLGLRRKFINLQRFKYKRVKFSHGSYQLTRNAKYLSNNFRSFLATKKRLKLFYGNPTEKYFKRQFQIAAVEAKLTRNVRRKEDLLVSNFERRLDSILFRCHFSRSFRQLKQIISHGNVLVNDKTIVCAKYSVKLGDIITLDPKVHSFIKKNVIKSNFWPFPPSYLQVNYKTFTVIIADDISISHFSTSFPFWLNLKNIFYNYSY